MNWDAVGAVGEILGALSVVATLVYLAIQVRQNSNLAKATIRENRIDSSQKVIFALSEVADIIVKRRENADLTATESVKLELAFRAMFRDFEGYAYQKHTGLLDDSEWVAMLETWRDALDSENNREMWGKLKFQYSNVLHNYLEEILSEPVTRHGDGDT